jgi:hypothetical protein
MSWRSPRSPAIRLEGITTCHCRTLMVAVVFETKATGIAAAATLSKVVLHNLRVTEAVLKPPEASAVQGLVTTAARWVTGQASATQRHQKALDWPYIHPIRSWARRSYSNARLYGTKPGLAQS